MQVAELDFRHLLNSLGFFHKETIETGYVFERDDGICVIIDEEICELKNYHYVDYTSLQNNFVHSYNKVFRFLHSPDQQEKDLIEEIRFFLGEEDLENVKLFGHNREEQSIDPTRPEAVFEECFIRAFGESSREALYREFPYFDREGKRRFVDYALFTRHGKFAIELNGEAFHHPSVIGPKRYLSQLFKQNSLTADGFKVFRWSLRGMADHERFVQELRIYLGNPKAFLPHSSIKIDRQLATIDLHDHQVDVLRYLAKERQSGRRNFLVVLPTGTGKTEIFIKDIEQNLTLKPNMKALILVPTRKLREQTILRFKLRLPKYRNFVGAESTSWESEPSITVQTYAYFQRHYHCCPVKS